MNTSLNDVASDDETLYNDDMSNKITTTYVVQCAIDAERSGYGKRSYWDYLEASSLEKAERFLAAGDEERADYILTRSLSEALRGNDGI